MNNGYVVELEHIATHFGDHEVHRDINLRLRTGEIVGLVGASGSGKTTLLRVMMGLEQAGSGSVTVLGEKVAETCALDCRQRRNHIGVLFQGGALFSALSVYDNIALPLRELGIGDEGLIAQLVCMRLSMVGLSAHDAMLMPAELSGGMIKRAALARALILEPELLLLDEPTSGLDPVASEDFVSLLRELHGELHFTVVMVTHDLHILRDLCSEIAVLADGRLIAFAPLREVLRIGHPFIEEFFHNQRARRIFNTLEVEHG